MLHSLILQAAEDPVVTGGLAAVGGAGVGALLSWLVKRFVRQTDESKKATAAAFKAIHEDLGTLKASRDRSKEKDDEQGKQIEALQKDVRELREKVIILEHDARPRR